MKTTMKHTIAIVLMTLLCFPLFAQVPRSIEQLRGDSQSILENVARRKTDHRRALKVENTTPNAHTFAYTWGTLENEDGTTWYYTQSFEERDWYIGSSEIVIYNNNFEEMSKLNVVIPQELNVNDIAPVYFITSQFFDTDASSVEIPVFVHAVDNGTQINKVYVYNLNGEKVQEYDSRSMIYFTAANDYRRVLLVNEINGDMIIDIMTPAEGDGVPTSEHQFVIDQDLLYYSNGPALSYYALEGNPYYSIAHFEKPCMDGMDPETFVPTQAPDNYLVVKTYNQNFERVDSLKISLDATDENATYGFASLGMLSYNDVRLGEFTNDNQRNYIITHYEYFAQSDEFSYHFKVYDQEGNYVKTIVENTSTWFGLSNIEGCEEQMAFLKMTTDGQIMEMIDIPSCQVAATFPAIVDGYRISTTLDRYPVGEDYQYVIGLSQAEVNADGDAIARIGWYNRDCSVDHYAEFNLGKNAEGFTPYIASYVLDPYLFNTDGKREYFYLAMNKRSDNSEVLDKVLYLADEDGNVLRTIKPEDGNEIEFSSGDIFDFYTAYPKMVLSFYNGEKDAFEIQYFNLPFDSFTSGGNGSQDEPYVITTPGELAQMHTAYNANFILGNDIDMSEYPRPYIAPTEFGSTFDGNNYTISNIELNNGGMFDMLHHGTVKNLQLQSPTLNIGDNNIDMGIIANSAVQVTIENVHIYDAYIYGNGDNSNHVGGILGQASYTDINAVSMLRAYDMYQINNFGGIVGAMDNSNINAAVTTGSIDFGKNFGGIASFVSCSNISNAHTEFALLLPHTSGGIVATLNGETFDSTIKHCYSTSFAYGELDEFDYPTHDYRDIVYTNNEGTITNCVGGEAIMNEGRQFFEELGFAYGSTYDAPWTGEGLPILYFENDYHSTPTIETVDNGIVFNGCTVEVCNAQSITIYNMQGMLVRTVNGSSLDVSGVGDGVYIVSAINVQGEHSTSKIAVR